MQGNETRWSHFRLSNFYKEEIPMVQSTQNTYFKGGHCLLYHYDGHNAHNYPYNKGMTPKTSNKTNQSYAKEIIRQQASIWARLGFITFILFTIKYTRRYPW